MVKLMCVLFTIFGYCYLAESSENVPTYYYIGPTKVTWNEAIRLCESFNMRIAGLETKEKYNLLYNWIIASGLPLDTTRLWTSLNRIPDTSSTRSNWYWITGEPLNYVQWYPTEPNGYTSNEQCVVTYVSDNTVKLADYKCSTNFLPLCEKVSEKNCQSYNNQSQCIPPTVNVSCK